MGWGAAAVNNGPVGNEADAAHGEQPRRETLAERQIRLAREAGAFDDLPGTGAPLTGLDDAPDEDWWIKDKLRREQMDIDLPPALAIRQAKRECLAGLPALTDEAEVRRVVAALNERIAAVNRAAIAGPPSTTTLVDVDEVITTWRSSQPQRAEPRSAATPVDPDEAQTGSAMLRRAFDWTFRSRVTGRIVIAQFPNVSLALFLVASIAQRFVGPQSDAQAVLPWLATVALAWWAVDEIVRGVNPWRRMLGVFGFVSAVGSAWALL